ncbi:MAG: hypothetical protein KDA87_05470 [Planctomycetales bacterium]|nr:hypothetical protein [Planctomycetales bacterium]
MNLAPHAGSCPVCENGLLRFQQCENCYAVSLICDECESSWSDVVAISNNLSTPPDGSYPYCVRCQANSNWIYLNPLGIEQAGLTPFIRGESR